MEIWNFWSILIFPPIHALISVIYICYILGPSSYGHSSLKVLEAVQQMFSGIVPLITLPYVHCSHAKSWSDNIVFPNVNYCFRQLATFTNVMRG